MILSEVSQRQAQYHSYEESNLKKIQINLFTKQKQTYKY